VAATAAFASLLAIVFGTLWRAAECRSHRCLRTVTEIERKCAQAEAIADQAGKEVARMRAALEALPMPVWRRCGERLVDCNTAYADALASSRQAVLAEGRSLVPTSARPAVSTEHPTTPLDIHVVIGGQRRLLRLNEAAGEEGETVGVAVDRTDLEIAHSELSRHVTAHAAVLESLTAAVAIFGPDKRLKFCNTAFTTLWGFDAVRLADQPTIGEILDRLHETRSFPEFPDFRAFKHARYELFTSLIEPRHELMHLPDGRTLQVTISAHPLGGLIYVYDDVSDRLALECSYNTLAQVQRATLDHLFEGVAVFGGDGRLKLHNPAFRALWGLSPADVEGEPHIGALVDKTRDLLDNGGDWDATRERMVAQVTTQTLKSGPLYRRDGSMLQVASVPLPDGEVLLSYLDVSDGARVEQALRERNEALETAGRLKTEFVANVSHELRTPLSTVVGFAEILHNQYFGLLNSSQQQYSRGILDSAHQLASLISDMIDLATIEAGDLELEVGSVDVPGMLRSIVNLVNERARSRGLDIHLHCPARIGAIVGDARRLKQALFNLVSNAIKFTPPGGAICVEAEQRDSELLLSVADAAGGIAAPERAGIFEQFARSPNRAASDFGLSLVKRLIELHGGAVEIETAPSRGVRITCRLPRGTCTAGARPGTTQIAVETVDSRCAVAA
jgi:signal transduction histidine kinase